VFNQAQIAMSTTQTTPLLVYGTSAGEFANISGTVQDPLPVLIQNIDASNTVYLGNEDVTTETGYPLGPNLSLALALVGQIVDIPYGIAASGSPKVAVLVGRQ
jgi:hypothetical protein